MGKDIDYVTDEIARLQQKKQNVDTAVAAQHRSLALNDSYRKRYLKYIEILVVLIFAGLAYLGISVAQQNFTVVPSAVFDAMMLVLLLYVAYYMWYAVIELLSRSEMNYDEIELPPVYDPSGNMNDLIKKGQLGQMAALVGTCQDDTCCGTDTSWDSVSGKCKKNQFTTLDQAFPTGSLTMPSFQRYSVAPAQDATTLSYGLL
jgi:hypothetical protein